MSGKHNLINKIERLNNNLNNIEKAIELLSSDDVFSNEVKLLETKHEELYLEGINLQKEYKNLIKEDGFEHEMIKDVFIKLPSLKELFINTSQRLKDEDLINELSYQTGLRVKYLKENFSGIKNLASRV